MGFRSPKAALNAMVLVLALTGAASAQQSSTPAQAPSSSHQANSSAVARYLMGRIAQNAGAWDIASANLGAALKQDPENPSLLRRTFLLSLGEGKEDEALALARRQVAMEQGGSFVAHALLVADDLRAGRTKEAAARVAKLPTDGMSPYLAPLLASWIAVAEKDYDRAVTLLDPLGSHDGFKTIRTQQLALIADMRGDRDAAFQSYSEVAKQGMPLRLALLIGNFQERSGAADAARKLYRSYLDANPDSMAMEDALARLDKGGTPAPLVGTAAAGLGEALFQLSSALHQEGAAEMALLYGRVALRLDPGQPLARMLVGDILMTRDRDETALAEFRTTTGSPGMLWMARLRQVEVLRQLDREDEAAALLQKMAVERPTRTDALLRLGDMYRVTKRFDEALTAYDAALARVKELRPRDWTLQYARAMTLDSKGDWPAAETALNAALALQPDQPSLLNYLGYSYVDRGQRLEEGKAMIEKAVAQRPRDGFFTDSLGWALFKLGKVEQAVETLEKALELEPADPSINDHLGDAYWAAGRKDEARFQWSRAAHQADKDDGLRRSAQAKLKNGLVATVKAENIPAAP
ncbi:tetratricopeptide repeat protein [Niveispirillum sp. KHB5.9]|uniref:tetratricopeptide repeat protein n=1 Tax=Niveispirillum sp. KHB5.9 TaxID=3400269 RepID=UPI003A8528D9